MNKILLVLILLLAVFVRFYQLNNNPPGLNWDEVSQGYNAYSILRTGTDEWGQLPITNFRAYGDYPTTFYLYSLVPIEAIFGMNEFSLRLPSAVCGVLLVLLVFYLSRKIFKNEKLSLLAAFLMALSPWSLMLSRQAIQVAPAILLLGGGIFSWFKAKEKAKWFLLGSFLIGLSTFAYHNTRILSPLIFVILLFLYRKDLIKNFKLLISVLVIAAVFFIPSFLSILSSEGSARAAWVGILDQGAINRINQSRGESNLPGPLPKLVNNKITYFLQSTLINYAGYFSPQFLGISGGTQYQFSIPGFGEIYPVELPFFYLGLIILVINFPKIEREKKLLLILLLLAPIPAAITRDPYQVVRAAIMLIPTILITTFGFLSFLNFLKQKNYQKFSSGVFLVILVILFTRYFNNLLFIYPKQYSFAWQYGYKQAVDFINIHGNDYQQIYITKKYGEPHEFLLFYSQYNPAKYKSDPNLVRHFRTNWYWVDRFDKYSFLNDWEVVEKVRSEQGKGNSLLITSPGNYPTGSKFLETINFLDGKPAFDIVEL